MVTIEDVYSQLIREGRKREYDVIAEFCVSPLAGGPNKKIDIVWVKRRAARVESNVGSLRHWEIKAAFEIEGYNVARRQIRKHKEQFDQFRAAHKVDFPFFIVLYTRADHRKNQGWGDNDLRRDATLRGQIDRGLQAAPIQVVDGRRLDEVFRSIPE